MAIEPNKKSVDELEAEAGKLRERLLEIELKIENQRKGKELVAWKLSYLTYKACGYLTWKHISLEAQNILLFIFS